MPEHIQWKTNTAFGLHGSFVDNSGYHCRVFMKPKGSLRIGRNGNAGAVELTPSLASELAVIFGRFAETGEFGPEIESVAS